MALEGLELTENANNFSIISAGIMQIMCDMLNTTFTATATTTADATSTSITAASSLLSIPQLINSSSSSPQTIQQQQANDLLTMLSSDYIKPAMFIMLSMDNNEKKRLYSYKLFLILIDRNTNLSVREKDCLIYSMCNQLYQYEHSDEKFIEYTISVLLNQKFCFNNVNMPSIVNTSNNKASINFDYAYLKYFLSQISSRIIYINLFNSLLYTIRKQTQLLHKCLQLLIQLFDYNEFVSKIDYLLYRSFILNVLFNLLHYYTVEYQSDSNQPYETQKNISYSPSPSQTQFHISPSTSPTESSSIKNSITNTTIINDIKSLMCLIMRSCFKFPDTIDIVQRVDNYSYLFNIFTYYSYDSSNIGMNLQVLYNSTFIYKSFIL